MSTTPPPTIGATPMVPGNEPTLCLCATVWKHLCPDHVSSTGNPYARVRTLAHALLQECSRPAASVCEEEREAVRWAIEWAMEYDFDPRRIATLRRMAEGRP